VSKLSDAAEFERSLWIGIDPPRAGNRPGKYSGMNLENWCCLLLVRNAKAARPMDDLALCGKMIEEFPVNVRSNRPKGVPFIRGVRSNFNRGALRAQKRGDMRVPDRPIANFDSHGDPLPAD